MGNVQIRIHGKGDKTRYKDSWKYIETELHSLERHSNLCVCLQEEKDRIEKQSMKTTEGEE